MQGLWCSVVLCMVVFATPDAVNIAGRERSLHPAAGSTVPPIPAVAATAPNETAVSRACGGKNSGGAWGRSGRRPQTDPYACLPVLGHEPGTQESDRHTLTERERERDKYTYRTRPKQSSFTHTYMRYVLYTCAYVRSDIKCIHICTIPTYTYMCNSYCLSFTIHYPLSALPCAFTILPFQ